MRHCFIPIAIGALLAPSMVAVNSGCAQNVTSPSPLDRWLPSISEASRRFGIPEAWIRAVMHAESGGRATFDGRPTTSHAGAMGLMQLMPETWAELRDQHSLGSDPYNPRDNILAGAAYLRALYERYGYPRLFAAYNAGPARFDDHLFNSRPLPSETMAYLATIDQPISEQTPTLRPSGNNLFFALHTLPLPSRPSNASPVPSFGGLFVSLNTVREQQP